MTSSSALLLVASLAMTVLALCRAQLSAPSSQGAGQAPPFLAEAGADKINEFYQFVASLGHLKDAEIDAKVKEWVGKQSDDVQKKYAGFEQEREKAKAQGEAAHEEAIKHFSEGAKKADKELSEIANNVNLSGQDKAKQINDKVQSLPKDVRDEIEGNVGGGRN
ncbi:hypothetical protein GPALN_005276 [Globodera pallida]|nr:hypothetical protein GPALN_005276 [Globodera pallida]